MLDSVVPSLKLCDEMFALNEKEWKKWVLEGEPQNIPFPGEANDLSEWKKCLIIKALRFHVIGNIKSSTTLTDKLTEIQVPNVIKLIRVIEQFVEEKHNSPQQSPIR